MPVVRFTIDVDCENPEPHRIIPKIRGDIFEEYPEDAGEDKKIGYVYAYLILRSRAIEGEENLFDAMDSICPATYECYEALFDEDGDWNEAVQELYKGDPLELDALFIDTIHLEPQYRGKGIGARVVRETIATFASSGVGIVAGKPFALQYSEWKRDDEEHKRLRAAPGFEEKRLADFARVTQFWTDLGFRKLPNNSDFYTYAPHLRVQPELPRVPRGRRRSPNRRAGLKVKT